MRFIPEYTCRIAATTVTIMLTALCVGCGGTDSLVEAIWDGDAGEVARLSQTVGDINAPSKEGNIPILEDFCRRFPKFTFLPSASSHKQLIEEGIDVALSVYGTIGFEYAALGKTVIHASGCNPCIAYDFNIHPKTVAEYESILLDLNANKLSIDQEKVCEYYYMRHIHNSDSWLFLDYESFLKKVGGYSNQALSLSYSEFRAEQNAERHQSIVSLLERFIDSGKFCLQKKRQGQS